VIPSTLVAVVIVALLFIPGYVALVVWNRDQGWTPKPDLQLFASAMVISALCHVPLFWLVPTLLRWRDQSSFTQAGHAWVLLIWFLAVALFMPTLLGLLAGRLLDAPKGRVARWVASTFRADRVSRAPTAWDVVWSRRSGWFVVVELKSGKYVGGKFGTHSAVAFWRDGHDLFLEEEWTVTDDGFFGADSELVPSSKGVWLTGEAIESVRLAGGDENR
jgi:hypothetical protein